MLSNLSLESGPQNTPAAILVILFEGLPNPVFEILLGRCACLF